MATLWQDVRFGLRKLRRSPGFALLSIATLALGIGANTAVFSVVYGVLLRPLSFPQSDRLVTPVWTYGPRGQLQSNVSYPTFRFWRDHSNVFQSLAAYTQGGFNLSGAAQAERVEAKYVSASWFGVLGVSPALGRDFLPREDAGAGTPVAILSYGLWQRQFGGDRSALGKSIALDGVPYTVIGVMRAGLESLGPGDLYIPLTRAPGPMLGGSNLQVIGRLPDGLSLARAQSGMQIVAEDYKRSQPGQYPPHLGIGLIPLQKYLGIGARDYLLILFGAVGFVLLIACANVAGLLIARAASRSGELALRRSLGAGRGRLVCQLLTESALLALGAAAASLPLAYGGLALLQRLIPPPGGANPTFAQLTGEILTRYGGIAINGWSLAFTVAAGVLTAVLFGVLPAWRAVEGGVIEALKEGGLRSAAGATRSPLRRVLVAGELAITMVLLAAALLLARTFVNLLRVGPGFDTAKVLSVQFWMAGSRYTSSPALAGFYRSLTDRMDRLPGVRASAVVGCGMPLAIGGNFVVSIETVPDLQSVDLRTISPGYFRALGVPLIAGRGFDAADTASATPVAVVNRAFARQFFGTRSPLGLHVVVGAPMKNTPFLEAPREIVGVVGDVKSLLNLPAEPTIFVAHAQANYATVALFEGYYPADLLVRTSGDPLLLVQPVRQALGALDPSLPVDKVQSMDQVRANSLAVERFLLAMMGIFAALALALSAVGIYGVLSFTVAQRTPEIGLRMAIGATPADVLRIVVADAAGLAVLGIAVGVAGAFALTRLLGSALYGVRPADPLSFAGTAALLAVVAFAACVIPAWRAMRVDPVMALRHE